MLKTFELTILPSYHLINWAEWNGYNSRSSWATLKAIKSSNREVAASGGWGAQWSVQNYHWVIQWLVSSWETGGLGKKVDFLVPSLRPLKSTACEHLPVCSVTCTWLCFQFSTWVPILKSLRWWAPKGRGHLLAYQGSVTQALFLADQRPLDSFMGTDLWSHWWSRWCPGLLAQEAGRGSTGLSLPWPLGVEHASFKCEQRKTYHGFSEILFAYILQWTENQERH